MGIMMIAEYMFQIFLSFGITTVSGVVDISCGSSRPYLGDPLTCTCTTDSAIGVDWQVDSGSLLLCFTASGNCAAVPPQYEVSNDVSGSSKIFQITIKSFSYSDCGNFICKDQAGTDAVSESLSLCAFDPSVPASLTENIVSGAGQIEITTGCLYRKDEIKATWYTVFEGNENEYIPDSSYSTPSSCASDVCGAETAYTLKIGFNYNKATKNVLKVKFRLKVYHECNASLQLELTTADDYYIESTSAMSTTTTAKSTYTTTSTAPASTSTTPTSTSAITTSVSESTTITLTTATATAISTTSSTSSTTEAKSETTTASADSSKSETVVIIVASVVGGLFVVGIVITIILMLLSQHKRRKHVSGGIHTYEENRNSWQVNGKSSSWQGYSNHDYTFYWKPSGHQFNPNPLIIRQSNRPVPYQYQPRNGNYRQSPYSSRYIYQEQSGKQFRCGYAGKDRRVYEAPNHHISGSLRPHYYSPPPNPQRSTSRMPVRETLHTDGQNYVVSDYSMYW